MYLDDALREKTVECFLGRLKKGLATAEERSAWESFIKRNVRETFGIFKDDYGFYKYVGDEWALSKEEIEAVLSFTESLECRAILLNFRNSL